MDLATYQREAARTMKNENLEGPNHAFANWGMGFIGEAAEVCIAAEELKKYNLKHQEDGRRRIDDEAGDFLWYAAALATHFGIDDFEEVILESHDPNRDHSKNLDRVAVQLIEGWKKICCHGHSINLVELCEQIADLVDRVFQHVYDRTRINLMDRLPVICAANIDKLKKRYPDGFTSENSVARLDVVTASEKIAAAAERAKDDDVEAVLRSDSQGEEFAIATGLIEKTDQDAEA